MIKNIFKALSRTRTSLSNAVSGLVARRFNEEQLEELEESLLMADLGFTTTEAIIMAIRRNPKGDFIPVISQKLAEFLPEENPFLNLPAAPTVVMVVGVNGTGKTTSVAKLAAFYRAQGRKILLVAADTYRAAAVEQLRIWSERLGIRLVCNEKSTDPSAVLFDGLTAATASVIDLVLVDTAGRLHTYSNLMAELDKIYGVISRRFPQFVLKSLITIDANLGQNSIQQARTFAERVKLDGAILTKFDGTAKGGMVFPLYLDLHIPTCFVGVGEKLDDLYPFDRADYISALLGVEPPA